MGMKTPPAPTSGWKAWQASGRRRSFWERILSHLTEALCAEVTVKVNTAEAEMTLEPVCVLPLGELITGQQAPCTGECLGPATLALAGTWAGHRPLLGRGMS